MAQNESNRDLDMDAVNDVPMVNPYISNDDTVTMTDTLTTLTEGPIEDTNVTMDWGSAIMGFAVHDTDGVMDK